MSVIENRFNEEEKKAIIKRIAESGICCRITKQ